MITISLAYAYSISFLYVLSSQNVQTFDFDLQVLYFTTTNEGVRETKNSCLILCAIASGEKCIKSWIL
jgi:hypothetical protein